MHIRHWVLLALLGIAAVGCTSSATTTTMPSERTSTSMAQPTTTAPTTTITTTTLDPILAAPLPVDPEVITGTLDNGLQYFIRYNDRPGMRAELRLAVDAGSLYEDADQAGVAHFLEHMMFNGTTRFPRNELTAVLESFGPQFGPDINASTSFDETLYELSVPVDDELLDLGVEVLREWAAEATNTPTDVVEERGVVLEEWRLRDQGLARRVNDLYEELLLAGTAYEGKAPIGNAAAIQATTPEVLDRFYRDWYRPDRMAVIAVGDFDVDEMETRIIAEFETLSGPESPRPAPGNGTSPENVIRAGSLADPEVALIDISVFWPQPAAVGQIVNDRQDEFAFAAATSMLANRLNDDALRGTVPFLGAADVSTGFNRAFGLVAINVQARPDEVDEAVSALVTELARVRLHGFSDLEFELAVDALMAGVEFDFDDRESTQDVEYAAGLVSHFLAGTAIMSAEQQYEVDAAILERLTRADVEAAFVEFIDTIAPRIVVVGPDDGAGVPSAAELEAAFATLPTLIVEPHEDLPELDVLMETPAPGFLADLVIDDDLGFATLTWENGATVILWPTTIAEGSVLVHVTSFGGTSLVPIEDVPEAELISQIVGRSGLGPADAASLRRYLADRVVSVSPWISETREGITASAASKDAEVMMQLIHLLMTEPRADDVALDNVLAEFIALDATRSDVPDLAIRDQVVDAYYSGDPRYFAVPSAADLAEFDADRAMEIFRERFANAGDFVFAIVGDFEPETMVDLVAEYVATLPGNSAREDFVDHQPLPPREVQLRTVTAGSDPQGEVQLYFTNQLEPTAKDRVTGRVMELIVNARLRDRIREELSATYSPRAWVSLQRDPDPFVETNVFVSGDPDRLDEISSAVLEDLADLAANGPTETQFATAVQQYRTEIDLINNQLLANALTTSFLYPDQPVTELLDRYELIDEITPADVRRLASIAYAANQRIEIRLVPLDSMSAPGG